MPGSIHLKFAAALVLSSFHLSNFASAQEAAPTQTPPPPIVSRNRPPVPAPATQTDDHLITVPAGTHLPLILRNGVNTKSAKAGDAVYFETTYPIGVGNRMAIPVGTFLRGQITEAKRPGRIRGRGEFRIQLTEIAFSTGYTVNLLAVPSSVELDGQVAVSSDGKITGPGGGARDAATIGLSTLAGGPIGGYTGVLAGSVNARNLAIGHGVGAAAGLFLVLLTRGPDAELPRGTTIDVEFNRPLLLDPAQLPIASTSAIDPLSRFEAAPVTLHRRRREQQSRPPSPFLLLPLLLLHP
jgi:hypothetical protein